MKHLTQIKEMPAWAQELTPLSFEQAAEVMGVSRRKFVDIVKDFPRFELRGRKKVFYPEHIQEIRECLNSNNTKMGVSMLTAPLMVNALEKLSALEAKEKQKLKNRT